MDYAASTADIEAPALTPQAAHLTVESPLTGHTRRDRAREPRSLARVAVSVAALCGCCTAIFCILAPLAWIPFAFIVWAEHNREPCDQPLPAWLEAYLLYALLMPYCKASILRNLCGWHPEADTDPPPVRVKTFSHLIEVIPIFWMLFARMLISRSHTCRDTSQALYHFVDWYSWFMLIFIVLKLAAGGFGILLLQLWITRNGDFPEWMQDILQKANAASPDTINKIETVTFDATLFADPSDPTDERPSGECCICLMAFDEDLEIKKTACGHLVHRPCLEEWLRRARTCPTCRKDLEEASEDVAESQEQLIVQSSFQLDQA